MRRRTWFISTDAMHRGRRCIETPDHELRRTMPAASIRRTLDAPVRTASQPVRRGCSRCATPSSRRSRRRRRTRRGRRVVVRHDDHRSGSVLRPEDAESLRRRTPNVRYTIRAIDPASLQSERESESAVRDFHVDLVNLADALRPRERSRALLAARDQIRAQRFVGDGPDDAGSRSNRHRTDRRAGPRRRPLPAATRHSTSRPACRRPSPRAAAGRILHRATETRTRGRDGRTPPAFPSAETPGSARACRACACAPTAAAPGTSRSRRR